MSDAHEAKQATPHATLLAELLDSRVPKSEREHAAKREIERLRAERDKARAERDALADVLPGYYYMDPPDGGNVPVLEQLRRMAKDAQRYLWLRGEHKRVDPICAVIWKRNGDRNGSEWVNTANIDAEIDAAMGGGNEN